MEDFNLKINASGSYTEEELKEYILFNMGFGSCSPENPFIDEDCDAEIHDIGIENNIK